MTEAMRMKHWPYMIVPDVAEIAEKKKKKKKQQSVAECREDPIEL